MKKRKIDVAILSDVRLGNPGCHAEEITAYLSSIAPDTLVLTGHFLETSGVRPSDFPTSHYKVVKKILNLASRGTQVYWLTDGNGGWSEKLPGVQIGNIEIVRQLILEKEGGKTWIFQENLIQHFPSLATGLLRLGKPGRAVLDLLRPLISYRSGQSEKRRESPPAFRRSEPQHLSSERPIPAVVRFALRKNYQALIFGHRGYPSKEWVEAHGKSCLYMNSGSWHQSLSAIEYAFKRWKIYYYCQDKLSPFYADEDLKGMDMNELLSDLKAKELRPGKAALGPDD